jgi:undecaprenyl-diphosphatase
MSPDLSTGRALLLGLLHGPAELLPVSSSAHIVLAPPLLGWDVRLEPAAQKAFEVALHAGTLAGLLTLVPLPPLGLAVTATVPAAVAGLLLEGPVQQRLGGRRATALGLLAGSAALVAADALSPAHRTAADVRGADALALGVAQALALAPGLSRLGMAIAAARARGFTREASFTLGRQVGLPVVAGATALKGWRLARTGLPRHLHAPFAVGAGAALAGTLAAAPLARRAPLRAAAVERVLLAVAALRHNGAR